MGKNTEFGLQLVIKAIDKATGPLKSIQSKFEAFSKPLQALGKSHAYKEFQESLSKVGEAAEGAFEKLHSIFELVEQSANAGAQLEHTSKRLGVTVDQFAQLGFAAKQSGVDQESFTSALDKLNKGLGEARTHSGTLYKFLATHTGTVFANQVAHAKNASEAVDLLAKAFDKTTDPTKRAALAAAAFGKGNARMVNFLAQGSKGIKELMNREMELAGSQEALAKGGEEFEKAMNETSTAFEGLKNAAIAPLLPVFSEFAKAIANFLAKHRDGLKKWAEETGAAISKWIEGGGLDRLVKTIGDITTTIGSVIVALGGFKAVAVAVGLWIGGPLLIALGGLVLAAQALLAVMGPVIAVFGLFAVAAGSVALAGYEIYKNWEPIKEFFVEIGDSITNTFDRIETRITHAKEAVGSFKKLLLNPLGAAIDVGQSLFKDSQAEDQQHSGLTPERYRAVQQQRSEAHVTVNFENVPKGVKVQRDPGSTASTTLNTGRSMADVP